MEFGKHLTKGIWGIGDKGLQVVYGIGYVILVIRSLPKEEFGTFVLVQEIFLILSTLATAFALQPLLKYTAERPASHRDTVGTAMILYAAFLLLSTLTVVALRAPLSDVLNAPALNPLMVYVGAMLAASFFRNFTLALLQARFLFAQVFWVDAVHFIGAPLLILISAEMQMFHSALDLIIINIVSLSLSSLLGLVLARGMLSMTLRLTQDTFQKMWMYGSYSLGGVTSYLVYSRADTFLLSAFTGPIQVAVYTSVKVFVRVFEMASQVVQMFVLPAASRFSAAGDRRSVHALAEKTILFATIGMMPVVVLFAVFPGVMIGVLYEGRYAEAVPMLRLFSLVSFVVPITAVGTNVLMGLGRAREVFVLALQILGVSLLSFILCIPWLGAFGAALGYVVASYVMALLTVLMLKRAVHITAGGILQRTNDIKLFLQRRLGR